VIKRFPEAERNGEKTVSCTVKIGENYKQTLQKTEHFFVIRQVRIGELAHRFRRLLRTGVLSRYETA
jgi:hypothetical protein